MFSTMLGDLHTHLDTLDNALKRRPIVSYFDGTTSIAVLRVSLPPQSGNTRSSGYLFLMNDGSKIVACSVDTPEKSWDDASSILTKYFKIFGDVPGRIPLSFQRDYSILMRMPVSLLPADNDLLLKMGQAKTVRSSYALPNPTVFVGDSAAEKIAFAEFYIKTGRTPLNREEFERGEPFEVVFPRFGVKLPYMTGIPQQCQALGNKTVSVRDEGLGEAASSTIFYKVPIRFDPARREFREETFFDKPFVPRPDGLKTLLARASGALITQRIADALDTFMDRPLSSMAFEVLNTCVKNTWTWASLPIYANFSYEKTWGGLRIGGVGSYDYGIPLLATAAQTESYLVLQDHIPSLSVARFHKKKYEQGLAHDKPEVSR